MWRASWWTTWLHGSRSCRVQPRAIGERGCVSAPRLGTLTQPRSPTARGETKSLTADGVHGPQRLDESRRVDLVALPLIADILPNHLRQQRVIVTTAQQRFDINFV